MQTGCILGSWASAAEELCNDTMNKISLERLTGFDSYDYLPSIGFHQGLFQTDTINLKNSEFGSKGTNACPAKTAAAVVPANPYESEDTCHTV